jgi:hypothetical protein
MQQVHSLINTMQESGQIELITEKNKKMERLQLTTIILTVVKWSSKIQVLQVPKFSKFPGSHTQIMMWELMRIWIILGSLIVRI